MKVPTIETLLVDNIKDVYNAESQILKALPKMAKAASSEELRAAFREHAAQTRGHVERLEKVFELLDVAPKGKKCKAIEGLLDEGKELLEEDVDPCVLDAGLICAAQKVEHYEMAAYGCLRTWAQLIGQDEVARLLQQTLDEEGETDKKLTRLAETVVNVRAVEA